MTETLIHTVVGDLLSRGWDALGKMTIIFPMQRAGLFLKQDLKQRMLDEGLSRPVVLPRMMTIDQWVDSLSPLRADDEIRSVFRLYKLYKQLTGSDLTLDAFYGWGQQLLTDFTASDMALIDVGKLMTTAAEAGQLDEICLDEETRERLERLLAGVNAQDDSVRAFFVQLWEVLPAMYEQFTAQQAAEGIGTKGARYRSVIEHWSELEAATDGRTYVFVGFNYLLSAEEKLMRLVQDRALYYWDIDADFTLDDGVYKFVRANIEQFGNNMPAVASRKPELTAIACSSSAAQAQYVHEWLTAHHHAGERTAIVIADEKQLEPVIYALPDSVQDTINITKGYPLRQTKVYSDVTAWLSDKQHDRREGETYIDVLRRLSAHLDRAAACARIREEGEEDTWQAILLEESYYQTQTVLRRIALLLTDPELAAEVNQLRVLRGLVRRALESVSIPFHGEPVTPIQIIGVLETRLLDFDNVLILNVEEGVVPNTAVDKSFLPFDLRKAHHMQTREEEAKIYAYNFFRLIRRAHSVTMLFSEASTDTGKKQMSRFLMQLLTSPDYQVTKRRLTEATELPSVPLVDTSSVTPLCRREWPNGLSISPSAIGDYVSCPRQFYLAHVEHITPEEGRTTMLSPSEMGTLLHGTLEAAYRAMIESEGQRVITPAMIDAFLGSELNLHRALDSSYEALNAHYRKYHPDAPEEEVLYLREDHAVENQVVLRTTKAVLCHDRELPYLEIVSLEKWAAVEETIAGVPVRLGGIIDRLDIVEEDGTRYLRILDYKTGGYVEKKMQLDHYAELFTDTEKRYFLQTLIYSAAVAATSLSSPTTEALPIMPQLLFTRRLQSADPHLYAEGVPVTDYVRQSAGAFHPLLLEKLTEMLTTDSFPAAEQDRCEDAHSYCPFHALCGRKKKEFF